MRSQGVQLDAVRVGGAFLGQCRRRKGDGLRNACHGEATLDTVRWLPKGHTVGAFQQARLTRPTRVAVISAGYRNGFGIEPDLGGGFWAWLRSFHNRKTRRVTFEGEKAKILGPVGADETAIDVTDLKCTAGDVVCFDINPLFAQGMARVYR